jgi:hypothetical protein
MRTSSIGLVAIALLAISGSATAAMADCESDMLQLEQAYKTPNLKPDVVAALDAAKAKSVSALKKDDDTACHEAIAVALKKAGIPMQ